MSEFSGTVSRHFFILFSLSLYNLLGAQVPAPLPTEGGVSAPWEWFSSVSQASCLSCHWEAAMRLHKAQGSDI